MKTLVTAMHTHGPAQNGVDGCHGRWANSGMCPGVKNAEWLNGLGDDEDIYIKGNPAVIGARTVTCGEVRINWLRAGNTHIVALEPQRAELVATITRLSAELRRAKNALRRIDDTHHQATPVPEFACGTCTRHGCATCHKADERCPCVRDGRT